jgi:membrane protease YdiL (CAAX protease family)
MLGNASKAVIVVSACMFGLLHGFVYFRGVAGSTTIALVASTLVLGWIAATVRQRFDSLMPAIFVHVVYNLTGIFFGFVAWPILTHLKA